MTDENKTEIRDPEGLLKAYEQAKADLVALRAENKNLTEQVTEMTSKMESMSEDNMRNRALAAETKLALQAQGIKDVDRLIPYIGTDGLDFDPETGKVVGLDDRLKGLQKDLPEIFDPKVRAGGKADIFADNSVETKLQGTEAQVARLFQK